MISQILWGSLILGFCTLIHLVALIGWIRLLRQFQIFEPRHANIFRQFSVIGSALAMIILVHTVQVWIWAVSLVWSGAIASQSDALYFALVTYTTVGYGDVTLSADHRIFGAMASVTGLLGFGISTAFLVGLLGKLFQRHLN